MNNESRPLYIKAGGTLIAEDSRIRVHGKACMTLLPDLFLVDIYNTTSEDEAVIRQAKTVSVLNGQNSLLCYGEIEDIYSHPEETNTITTLVLVDGKTFWNRKVSKTLGAGAGVKNTLTTLLDDGSMGFFAAADVRMLRGQTFSGKLPEIVSMLAKTAGARAFYTHGAVLVISEGKAQNILEIDEDSVIDEPSRAEGVIVLKTQVLSASVGTIVTYSGRKYRLASQTLNLDTKHGPWQTEMTLVREDSLDANGLEGG